MAGLEDTIGQVLSNPQAMQQIFSLAQSLGLSQPREQESPPQNAQQDQSATAAAPAPPPPPEGTPEMDAMLRSILEFAGKAGGDERQLALFEALKPFLKPERARQIDKAIQVARISRMAGAALQRFGMTSNSGGDRYV